MRTRLTVIAAHPGCGIEACSKPTLYRPQTGYYADLIEEAAALWESLSQNHPFIDGNKRTAFAAMYTFLAINGGIITAEAEATYAFIMGLYGAGTFDFKRLAQWLRNNVSIE